jgi:lipopolysaccharide export system protein LptA
VRSLVNNKWMGRGHLVVTLTALGVLVSGLSQVRAAPQKNNVVRIVSDRLEAYQQQRQVIFIGHVVATQKDLTIRGDRMTIFYSEEDAKKKEGEEFSGRIDRIVVEGNVHITQKEIVATGNHAVYYRSDNKVVLTGTPRVQRDKDFIKGASITLFLDSEKSIVEGGPSGPVEAAIYSSETGGSVDKGSVEGTGRSEADSDGGG